MTLTLGLDTSTVVAVGLAGGVFAPRAARVDDPRAHAEQLMPLVTRLIAEADVRMGDISRIAVGVGPGPFTGLRVGVVTALTLGEVLHVPVQGICSLDIVAAQWVDAGAPEDFVIVSDARRREVYWARYLHGVRVGGPVVSTPQAVPKVPLGGPGAALVGDCTGPVGLDAAVLARVGFDFPDAGTEPLYLRRPDAEVPSTPKSALPQARLSFGRRS